MLRRILKWTSIVMVALALVALIVVWGWLGVFPYPDEVDQLWLLTSNEVEVFVRFPPLSTLEEEPLYRDLPDDPPFGELAKLRRSLIEAQEMIARDINPQIPLGLVEIDLKNDFLNKESALGARLHGDYSRPRLKDFVFLVRIPFYARLLSALKRDTFRDKIKGVNIELVNGIYFRIDAPPEVAEVLAPFRTPTRADDTEFFFARIQDVVVFSDNEDWIRHAIQQGVSTLKADAWFDSEFIDGYRGGSRIEIFARPNLTTSLLSRHSKPNERGPLSLVRKLMPLRSMGELVASVGPDGADEVTFQLSNALANEGFASLPPHLQALYDLEKGDARLDLSQDGIGRLIPSRRTVGALVLHARPAELIEVLLSILTPAEKSNADSSVRDQGSRYPSFRRFLEDLTSDFGRTHLLILHRPSIYEGEGYHTFEDERETDLLPPATFHITLVSTLKDNIVPNSVTQKMTDSLKYLWLEGAGMHESGKFVMAKIKDTEGTADESLLRPVYGVLPGQRLFLFSTNIEAARAVVAAAENPATALIARPGIDKLVAGLTRESTVTAIFDGVGLKNALWDRVREFVQAEINVDYWMKTERLKYPKMTNEEMRRKLERYKQREYPLRRDEYQQSLAALDLVDAIGFTWTLGVGGDKKVTADGVVRLVAAEE